MSYTGPERRAADRGPGVLIPPPAIFALALVFGFWLQDARPLALVTLDLQPWLRGFAAALALISLGLGASALRAFKRKANDPRPWTPDHALIDDGPFRFSRNPMYLALIVLHLAIALGWNALWPLLMLLPPVLAIRWYVIPREEAYLHRRFGTAYEDYCRRVRRWLL